MADRLESPTTNAEVATVLSSIGFQIQTFYFVPENQRFKNKMIDYRYGHHKTIYIPTPPPQTFLVRHKKS